MTRQTKIGALAAALALALGLSGAAKALTIVPTFDNSVLAASNAQDIQNCINSAIAIYNSLYTDDITVSILFRYSDTTPQGKSFSLGESVTDTFRTSYATFITALMEDKQSPGDASALNNLPAVPPAPQIRFSSANGRALGMNTLGHLDAQGGGTGSFDGIVSLSSVLPLQFNRAGGIQPGNYDAQLVAEHEIDEVLGLGSILDQNVTGQIKPEDLFRYSTDSGSPQLSLNPGASATSYFSIDGGATDLIGFNQSPSGDRGDWLSPGCSAETANPQVQYAFTCRGITTDIAANSPEGVALDVIGYDLAVAPAGPPSVFTSGVAPVFSKVTTIQPGSWASIYGTNLASVTASWKGEFPTELAGTTVTVHNQPAYLWFVSSGQINFQAPDDGFTGPVNVVVTTAAGSSAATVNLAPLSPSFSLLDGMHVAGVIPRADGSGAYGAGANSFDIVGPTGTSLGYKTVAAKAGETVTLYGVGFGPTAPSVPAGAPFTGSAPALDTVSVQIHGIPVTPSFVGIIEPGLFQINLTIPRGAGAGDVPLSATVGGASSQPFTVISLQ